ncbi:MAG: Asp-tRNA(Asn)/Glu-tRNA(Gln) amidotransferase subunit GatA [Solirubrobacterales bacterium]|nr:Asp-tRNA(Asn)/Glu-tRNA(Gln) amidotransferase subunit GatA [Solirubrobacterales bacterium]OJU94066.1 MAG: glutaminyl-tRNA synthase (glutamine-hydrolyzing) subunit A [Solirubrobacterales bacterium 67-14]
MGNNTELLAASGAETAAQIAAGEVSAAEVLDFWLARAAGDGLNGYLWQADRDSALSGVADSGGPLAGAPIAIKDIFCTEGVPTTAASKILSGYVPPYTATAVGHLRAAGMPMLGKTNMDEFAMGSSNENSAFGACLNPWDTGRVPGGSSGGSAAVVAGGLAPWSLGTDTGGSIRQPAGFCGIVGLKPTYGAISRFGMIAFASSLDQCGPLTRDVTDAALLLAALQGRDEMDSTSVGIEGGIEAPSAERLDGLTFGVPRDLMREGIEAGVLARFEDTLIRIAELGGEIVDIELPHAEHAISAYYVLAPAEASTNLSRYDGVRYGLRASDEDLLSMYEVTREEGFGPEVKRRIMLGTYALSSGYYDAYYGGAQRVRTRIVEDFQDAFGQVDFVVTPTSPTVAFELGEKTADPWSMYLSDIFTVPISLAGVPAISIPAGLAEPEGGGPELPVGFQIAAPAFAEQKLLEAAHALEGAIGFDGSAALEGGLA